MDSVNAKQLRTLLNEGNIVERPPFSVASIVEEGLARKERGMPIPGDRAFLLDPRNWDETVIILRDPTSNCRSLIVTRDQRVIEMAQASLLERFEPVGIWIRARCELRGGSATTAPDFHVDRLVKSLVGVRGWIFEPDDQPGRFFVSKMIRETGEHTRTQNLLDLAEMLDSLAVALGKGVHTWHLAVSSIPKEAPAVSWGKEEHMVSPLSAAEVSSIGKPLVDSRKRLIAGALNRSYCEISKQAKLTALWACCENVMAGEPERMLTDETVDAIVGALETCEQLVDDCELLQKARPLLTDVLKKLSRKTRNDRISERIAALLGISSKDARRQVSRIFKLRGDYVHSLVDTGTASEADTALAFLHSALLRELEA